MGEREGWEREGWVREGCESTDLERGGWERGGLERERVGREGDGREMVGRVRDERETYSSRVHQSVHLISIQQAAEPRDTLVHIAVDISSMCNV